MDKSHTLFNNYFTLIDGLIQIAVLNDSQIY